MKRMTKLLCLILAVALLLPLTGCLENTSSGNTKTIVDHDGYSVTVPEKIQRVVVCDIYPLPSVLSIFFDSAEKIVGMAPTSMSAAKNSLLGELYPEILNASTAFMEGGEVNVEELMKLQPDVVFYSAGNSELSQKLRNAGFNAIGVSTNKWEYDCMETLNQWIQLFSQLFPDNSDKVEKVQKKSQEMYDLVQKRVGELSEAERERVFFLFSYSETAMATSGSSFFGQWWAETVGAVNVAEEVKTDNSVAVNLEQVYQWNPSMILITNFNTAQPKDLYENTVGNYDWSGIDAVQNKQVYKMPLGMSRSYTPGVDTPITMLWLAKTVYPELFKDLNVTEQAKEYYQEVFGVSLTDAQINGIFQPTSGAGEDFFLYN